MPEGTLGERSPEPDSNEPSAPPNEPDAFAGETNAAAAALVQLAQSLKEPGDGASAAASQQLLAMASMASASFMGPLPPPEILRGYEDVLPGAADRILKMAETQASHRQGLESIAVNGGNRRSWWGLALGFIISLVVFGLGTAIVLEGHSAAGATVMSVDVVGLAGVFVYGQQSQRKERLRKNANSQLPSPQ